MKQSSLSEQKSILAKLLAGENISIIHSNVPTAAFDLYNRILYCPIWKDMSPELYDLLMGHEVSHALNTPKEGWHSSIKEGKDQKFKDFLNVCEDARIEKLIKRKYPGLSKSFYFAYKELYNKDIFRIKNLKDLSILPLIDRINLYFKCGTLLKISFSDKEMEFVNIVGNTENWEDVVAVAKALYEEAKKDIENHSSKTVRNLEELEKILEKEEEEEEEEEVDSPKSDNPSEEKPQEKSTENNDVKEENKNSDNSEEKEEISEEESEKPEPQSITDSAFRSFESSLSRDDVNIHNVVLPKVNLKNIIISNEVFISNFMDIYKTTGRNNQYKNINLIDSCYKTFISKNKSYINFLIKEFEMRKNAFQYARNSTAKSGILDMNKLSRYKLTNDIFKKVSVVNKGKSHGVIMFVDMSSSMRDIFGPTLEQTLMLVSFCKKVGIPFDVYGFSDDYRFIDHLISKNKINPDFARVDSKFTHNGIKRTFTFKNRSKIYEKVDEPFHIINLISSKLSNTSYSESFNILCFAAFNFKNIKFPYFNFNWGWSGFNLHSTPLMETIVASKKIIDEFKMNNKVDITNVIYLTDGAGNASFEICVDNQKKNLVILIDDESKERSGHIKLENIQAGLTSFIRKISNCKHIGFYIFSGDPPYHMIFENDTTKKSLSFQEKRKITNGIIDKNGFISAPSVGYDNFYYVRSKNMIVDDNKLDFELNENMTFNKKSKLFNESQTKKIKYRVLISNLIDNISNF